MKEKEEAINQRINLVLDAMLNQMDFKISKKEQLNLLKQAIEYESKKITECNKTEDYDYKIYEPIGFFVIVICLLIDGILWVINYFKTKYNKQK